MLPRANLLVLPFVLMTYYECRVAVAIENDTAVVGSLVHETKVKPPADLSSAGSKKHRKHEKSFDDDFGDDDFKNAHSSRGGDKDGYNKYNTYHTTDGDGYGYSTSFAFSDKDNGKKHGGKGGGGSGGGGGEGYDHDDFSFDDEDEAADSISPKFSAWNYGAGTGGGIGNTPPTSSSKLYRFQNDDGGKLVGPDYEGYGGGSTMSKRMKRKKDNVQPSAATDYDNYDYADVEEPEEAPADFEAEEAPDPEYGPVYADAADAYDYY